MIDVSKMKKKIFDINYFMDTYLVYEHKKVVELLEELKNKDIISPVKNSPLTVKYPQVHTKYRVQEKIEEVDESIINEINFKLNSKIKIDYIRNNIKTYIKDRENILSLSNFLDKKNCLDEQISLNERSYEIFGDEKYLSKDGKELLKILGLSYDDLNVYLTPEPFFYSSSSFDGGQTVLIVENKDTYITLLKILNKTNMIFGVKIDTLIYGEGKKIISSFNSIYEDNNLSYLNDSENKFFYWGDIDKEGFYIYGLLKKQFPNVNMSLFNVAYKTMLSKYNQLEGVKRKCLKEQSKNYMLGLSYLDGSIFDLVKKLIEDKYYIPQEILTIKELNKS